MYEGSAQATRRLGPESVPLGRRRALWIKSGTRNPTLKPNQQSPKAVLGPFPCFLDFFRAVIVSICIFPGSNEQLTSFKSHHHCCCVSCHAKWLFSTGYEVSLLVTTCFAPTTTWTATTTILAYSGCWHWHSIVVSENLSHRHPRCLICCRTRIMRHNVKHFNP